MGINNPPDRLDALPSVVPVFPLTSALLLPRGELPLNIFEPRCVSMIEDALRADRIIGMLQPQDDNSSLRPAIHSVGCIGKITQFAETGDGRFMISLTGLCRFRVAEELTVITSYRQCLVSYDEFARDLVERDGEDLVNRPAILKALREFAEANRLKIDWKSIEQTPNEALVNALAMMSPFGPNEKQALLEAKTLAARADVLVAITEIELARGNGSSTNLQ